MVVVVLPAGASAGVAVQAPNASVDVAVQAAGGRVTGLVADVSTFSAPGSDALDQDYTWGGEAAWPYRAQFLVVAVPGARATDGAVVLAAWGADVVVRAAGGSVDVVLSAAWSRVTGMVADEAACSAAVADAQNQHDAEGGEAARPCRAQVIHVGVLAAGSSRNVAVLAADANQHVPVLAAAGRVDIDVPAAAASATGLVADISTFSAPGSDAHDQNDALGGEAAWPCRAQVVVVVVQAAGAGRDAAVQVAGASTDVAVGAAGARADTAMPPVGRWAATRVSRRGAMRRWSVAPAGRCRRLESQVLLAHRELAADLF